MVQLVNIMESTVFETLEEVLKDYKGICKCERCKYDMAAISLNKLPPSYVMTPEGAIMSRVASLKAQNVADVVRVITESIGIVSNNPRHD